ncbi:MAG: ATP-dependent DNA helicase RecG [candidate division KSB1 bacterium]|nr:ATP-dependent DNA helicase RecG [candidate division KSB1 bacterium]
MPEIHSRDGRAKLARPLHEIPVAEVRLVGEQRARALKKAGIQTVEDLLFYFPRRYLDRSDVRRIAELVDGVEATVVGTVHSVTVVRGRRPRLVVTLTDGTGFLHCVWFQGYTYLQQAIQRGEQLAVSGRVTRFGSSLEIAHPEFDRIGRAGEGSSLHTGKIVPLYPSSQALDAVQLDSRGFRRILASCLQSFRGAIRETLPEEIRRRRGLVTLAFALENVHFPSSLEALKQARRRLKFDELFYLELLLALRHRGMEGQQKGLQFKSVGPITRELIRRLPYELTAAQRRVLREIYADMRGQAPMHRLLQGDVGSGKTIVAVIAMVMAVENGYQAALMAPTEILAEQHYLNIRELLRGLDVRVRLLIGGLSQAEKEAVREEIAAGRAEIIIGTHALIQEEVAFPALGLVVIDEQHRFGVMQRRLLQEKGLHPDVLMMTATPIPRTLSMTVYGDLDVSVIDELPAGRKRVKTVWRDASDRPRIYKYLKSALLEGRQAYVVFPLVEESEKSDLKAATDCYEKMRASLFRDVPIGLLHGRLPKEEKERVMAEFKEGQIRLLVCTTVVEVGVDVPNATIMVIEHAERFGLTQLHQLRGRVGRGAEQSYCILISYGQLTPEAEQRLRTMVRTDNGFEIAEIDLQLRGPGEFFGTRQHGFPELRIADLVKDTALLQAAREEAFRLAEQDPHLSDPEHEALRDFFLRHYREGLEFVRVA